MLSTSFFQQKLPSHTISLFANGLSLIAKTSSYNNCNFIICILLNFNFYQNILLSILYTMLQYSLSLVIIKRNRHMQLPLNISLATISSCVLMLTVIANKPTHGQPSHGLVN